MDEREQKRRRNENVAAGAVGAVAEATFDIFGTVLEVAGDVAGGAGDLVGGVIGAVFDGLAGS